MNPKKTKCRYETKKNKAQELRDDELEDPVGTAALSLGVHAYLTYTSELRT